MKGDKESRQEWINLPASRRIRRMRTFCPKAVRRFQRSFKKQSYKEFRSFLEFEWRKFSLDFLNNDYWKPVEETGKNYIAIVGGLWEKMCTILGKVTAENATKREFDLLSWELYVYMMRMCQHKAFVAYSQYKFMCNTFILNFCAYDVNDSDMQGPLAWAQGAFIAMIKYADRPRGSSQILAHLADELAVKVGAAKQLQQPEPEPEEAKKNKDGFKMPDVWNECCKMQLIMGICIAIDCTEQHQSIKDMKEQHGKLCVFVCLCTLIKCDCIQPIKAGMGLIKKLSEICAAIFGRTENNSFPLIVEECFKLLSRLDIMDSTFHDKVLKQMKTDQRKKYTRNFGKTRISRHTVSDANYRQSVVSKQYGAATPGSPTKTKGYNQRFQMSGLAASITSNRIKKSTAASSAKNRIIDEKDFSKLQNPFEFKISEWDILAAFRYADVNQDNAISFTDFTQSLVKVGLSKGDDEAMEMWLVLNPQNNKKGKHLWNSLFELFDFFSASCN